MRFANTRGSKSSGRWKSCVGDLPADARQAENPHGVALVGVADEVELTALEQELVRVDLALALRVALHRVVAEGDGLAPGDRRVDLHEALGQVVAAGRGGDPERDRTLVGRAQRARPAPGDLLQREAQRLGVRELAVEQGQSGL
jgi:hypothetical protein